MNMAHFHLVSVHLPIVAMPLLVLLLMAGIGLKKPDLYRTALMGMVIVALLTIPIFLSGEGAEEVVEHLPSISENQIEVHEEAATIASVMVALSGLVGVVSLLATRFQLPWVRYSLLITLLISFVSSGTLIWAANEGGKIRHTETLKAKGAAITNVESSHIADED